MTKTYTSEEVQRAMGEAILAERRACAEVVRGRSDNCMDYFARWDANELEIAAQRIEERSVP